MADILNVINNGYCVGCGACAIPSDKAISMRSNRFGMWEAFIDRPESKGALQLASRVCPFSGDAPNENQLAEQRFSEVVAYHPQVGKYISLYLGRVSEVSFVRDSSSGGLTSFILVQLLRLGHIDGVIHVGQRHDGAELFSYEVSHSVEEIQGRRKSQYYSTEWSSAVASIRGNGRRYAIVGVPCSIKAARSLALADPALDKQLKYFIGLICGHMKSANFAKSMAWQVGVSPKNLERVDFRFKKEGAPASEYEFSAWKKGNGQRHGAIAHKLLGGVWGHAFFQPKACDYCDDIFAETADVCLGDAWLSEEVKDWRGMNVVVVRDALVDQLIQQGRSAGTLEIKVTQAETVLRTQEGNFRHRWDGLSVRLADAKRIAVWVPRKRIGPGQIRVNIVRRMIVRARQRMAIKSHIEFLAAIERDNFDVFRKGMSSDVVRMKWLYKILGIYRKIFERQ